MGFVDEEISVFEDRELIDLKMAFNNAQNMMFMNMKKGLKTLMFCYYAGHGACVGGNTAFILDDEYLFKAERLLRTFAK